MYFEIIQEDKDCRIINIKLTKIDIEVLLRNKSISDWDFENKLRIELE